MNSRVSYDRLKNYQDLQRERIRINREIRKSRKRLGKDYELVTELFTVEYWTEKLLAKLANISTVFQLLFAGFNTVRNSIRNMRNGGCEEEDEYETAIRNETDTSGCV